MKVKTIDCKINGYRYFIWDKLLMCLPIHTDNKTELDKTVFNSNNTIYDLNELTIIDNVFASEYETNEFILAIKAFEIYAKYYLNND